MSRSCSIHCLRTMTIAAIITRKSAPTNGIQHRMTGNQNAQGTGWPRLKPS